MRCGIYGWMLVAALAAPAQADPSGEVAPTDSDEGIGWPEPLSLSITSGVGVVNLSDVSFQDSESPLQMSGEQMAISRVELVGVEGVVSLTSEVFRFNVGFAYYVPRNGDSAPLPEIGPDARLDQLHISRWLVELGVGHRFENITPFVLLSGSVLRTIADVRTPELSFAGMRLSFGPRVGLRAHVYKRLFVQAAVYADLLSMPDHTLTLGLGVGDR